MVLFSFSVPQMIPDILSGKKAQTTRQSRKPRKNGAKPYSVGEKVQLYYRSRCAKSCNNCLISGCLFRESHEYVAKIYACEDYSNFFGEAVITAIQHYWITSSLPDILDMMYRPVKNETWMGSTIGSLAPEERDKWAILDGFPNGFEQAHEFFVKSTGDKEWMYKNLDVIRWNGQQIARRVA